MPTMNDMQTAEFEHIKSHTEYESRWPLIGHAQIKKHMLDARESDGKSLMSSECEIIMWGFHDDD